MKAFASAIASGSLAKLEYLYLNDNKIGDAGMTDFSRQIASRSLANLKQLSLNGNQIGDAGMAAFTAAIRTSGSLPAITKVVVDTRHEEHAQLVGACKARGIEIASCTGW